MADLPALVALAYTICMMACNGRPATKVLMKFNLPAKAEACASDHTPDLRSSSMTSFMLSNLSAVFEMANPSLAMAMLAPRTSIVSA
eukprot:5215017-Amphidinium_carterae.1